MTILSVGVIILVFGLIQSLLSFLKDFFKQYEKIFSKIQAALYIGLFIFGLYSLLLNKKKESDSSFLQNNIYSSVSSQFTTLNKIVIKNDSLIKSSVSINQHLILQNQLNKSLNSQYEKVNSQLSKQIDLEIKKFKDSAPSIDLIDSEIYWDGKDSTKQSLNVPLMNSGKRNANILGTKGYILFFNKNNQIIFYADFPEIKRNSTISEIDKYTCTSYPVNDFHVVKLLTDYAVICLNIHYKDIGLGKDTIIRRYTGWIRNDNSFGSVKDWQTNMAKNWAIENGKN